MALSTEEAQLLRVSKATNRLLRYLRDGVFIEAATSRSIDELKDQVCADRLALAATMRETGDRLMRTRPASYRGAISRYYYSMYHAMRAAVYYSFDGDDHERHDVLPGHTPRDFPNAATWENALKDARAHRNEADYDPYPSVVTDFAQPARDLRDQAHALEPIVRGYLQGKGCRYL